MVNLVGFGLSAAVNGGIALVVFCIFCYTRKQAANRFVYYPRTFHPAFRGGRPPPPPLPSSFIGWLWPLLQIDRATVIASCGLDAYMFLRFLELCCLLFLGMIPLGVGILVPVDYTAVGGQDGFEAISVSNVDNNSPRLAAHVIVAYLFAAWTYLLLFLVWLEYRQLRTAWLAQEQLSNRALTVLVQALPETARTDAAFLSTFRSQLPSSAVGSAASTTPPSPRQGLLARDEDELNTSAMPRVIHSAYVAKDIGKMSDAVSDRDKDLNGMEHAVLQFEQEPEERPQTATKCFCCSKQDSLTYLPDDMGKQDALLAEGRQAAVSADSAAYSNGFVTFDSVSAFTAVVNDSQKKPYVVRIAPELRDVYWPSLSYTAGKRLYMGLLVSVLLYLLVFFWIIPVAFTQSIANLQSLANTSASWLSWLSFINDIPAAALGIIDGFLPGLILTIFNIVLPMILHWFSRLEGIEAWSWLQFSVVDKFTIFQVINNFFFTTVSTAVMANPQQLFSNSSLIVTTLGQSIPQTATFFITYLLFNTFAVYPMMLLNPGGWIVGRLKRRYTVKTARDLVSVQQASAQNYGTAYPILIFAFIITITFSILAPIVLPFAVLYYAFAYVSFKHQYLYVYNTAFETGGAFWPVICRKLAWCMFSGQIVFTALLGIKKAPAPAAISAPLIILPFLFIWVVERRFLRQTEVLPADAAAQLDAQRERRRRQGGSRTPFLDENSALQDFGYDQSAVRAMRQGDIVYRHNTCTPDKAEQYHRQLLRKRTVGEGGGGDKGLDKPAPGSREERKDKSEDASDGDGSSSLALPISHSSSMSAPAETATSRPVPLHTVTSGRSIGNMEEKVIEVGSALRVFHPRYATLQQTLEAGNGLGALPPAQDYIQPELLAPATLPIPRQVPAIGLDRSLEQEPELYDLLSDEALEKNAGEPGKLGKEAAGGADGQQSAAGSPPRSPVGADNRPMVRQPSSGGQEPDSVQVVMHH